jgi:predicted nuclease with TOPRIM domain
MNEELIKDKLETHDKRLNDHAGRIDKLEQYQSRSEVQINNLCDQIKNLVTTMKWFMGVLITTLIGFFIWYIQHI